VDIGNRLIIVCAGEVYLNPNPFPFLEAVGHMSNHSGVNESHIRVAFAGQCEFHGGISVRAWFLEFELLSLGRGVLMACEPYSDTARRIVGIERGFAVRLSETEQLDDFLHSFYRQHVVEGRMSPPTKESVLWYPRSLQNERYGMLIDKVGLGIPPDGCHGD
jgi:hypothetical protein